MLNAIAITCKLSTKLIHSLLHYVTHLPIVISMKPNSSFIVPYQLSILCCILALACLPVKRCGWSYTIILFAIVTREIFHSCCDRQTDRQLCSGTWWLWWVGKVVQGRWVCDRVERVTPQTGRSQRPVEVYQIHWEDTPDTCVGQTVPYTDTPLDVGWTHTQRSHRGQGHAQGDVTTVKTQLWNSWRTFGWQSRHCCTCMLSVTDIWHDARTPLVLSAISSSGGGGYTMNDDWAYTTVNGYTMVNVFYSTQANTHIYLAVPFY